MVENIMYGEGCCSLFEGYYPIVNGDAAEFYSGKGQIGTNHVVEPGNRKLGEAMEEVVGEYFGDFGFVGVLSIQGHFEECGLRLRIKSDVDFIGYSGTEVVNLVQGFGFLIF